MDFALAEDDDVASILGDLHGEGALALSEPDHSFRRRVGGGRAICRASSDSAGSSPLQADAVDDGAASLALLCRPKHADKDGFLQVCPGLRGWHRSERDGPAGIDAAEDAAVEVVPQPDLTIERCRQELERVARVQEEPRDGVAAAETLASGQRREGQSR